MCHIISTLVMGCQREIEEQLQQEQILKSKKKLIQRLQKLILELEQIFKILQTQNEYKLIDILVTEKKHVEQLKINVEETKAAPGSSIKVFRNCVFNSNNSNKKRFKKKRF